MTTPSIPTLEWISPSDAERYLVKNSSNRPLRDRRKVAAIAKEITSGRWQVNGATVLFSEDGTLLDGQHRLHAVIRTNTPIQTYVIRGLPKDCFKTIDTTMSPRTAGDLLAINKHVNYVAVASVSRLAYLYLHTPQNNPFDNNAENSPSPQQILEFAESNPRIIVATDFAVSRHAMPGLKLAASLLGFSHWRMSTVDQEEAENFLTQVSVGTDLPSDSPILLCRNRILADKMNKAKLPKKTIAALIFKTWRAHIRGMTLRQLTLREKGARPEKDLWAVE